MTMKRTATIGGAGALFLTGASALDVVLDSISCDSSLPVSLVESTFHMTCNGNKRCSISRGDTALIKGHIVLNNIEDSGIRGSTAYLRAHIETLIDNYALINDGTPLDLCGDDEQENNGDDGYSYATDDAVYNTAYDNYVSAYATDDGNNDDNVYTYNVEEAYFKVDDAYFDKYQVNDVNDVEECPQDGVYAFETEFTIPKLGRMWKATGWRALGDVKLAAGGSVIGSCTLAFETKAFGMSSKKFFTIFASVMSVTLFVGIFLAIRRAVGYGFSDDAKDFHQMGDDVCRAAADAAITPCSHPSETKEKDNDEDLECTFESDSTPSFSETEECIDTSFGTPDAHTRRTPSTRSSPITAREFMIARCHSLPSSDGVAEAFRYQFQHNPPSPIRNDDIESIQSEPPPPGPSTSFPTPTRDDSYLYSPPRHIV